MTDENPDVQIIISRPRKGLLGKVFPKVVGMLNFNSLPDSLKDDAVEFTLNCVRAHQYRHVLPYSNSLREHATVVGGRITEGLREYRIVANDEEVSIRTTFTYDNRPCTYEMGNY